MPLSSFQNTFKQPLAGHNERFNQRLEEDIKRKKEFDDHKKRAKERIKLELEKQKLFFANARQFIDDQDVDSAEQRDQQKQQQQQQQIQQQIQQQAQQQQFPNQPFMSLPGGQTGDIEGNQLQQSEAQPIRDRNQELADINKRSKFTAPSDSTAPRARPKFGSVGEKEEKPFMFVFDPNSQNGIARVSNPRFEADKDRKNRERKESRENRLNLQSDFRALKEFGGILDPKQIERFSEEFGFDLASDLESDVGSGRVTKKIGKDGKVSYKIMSDKKFDRMISEGKFSTDEQKVIRQLAEETNAWLRVVKRLEDAGITAVIDEQETNQGEKIPFDSREGMFDFVMEKSKFGAFGQPVGLLSVPARSTLARQFMKNPALAAVARDVEIAFQKWRIRVTGVQASDKELTTLRKVIANLSDNPRVFFQTIKNFTETTQGDYDTLLDIKENFGRDVSQFRNLLKTSSESQDLGFRKEKPSRSNTQKSRILKTGDSGTTSSGLKYRITK